ncbi:MAG: metallophosphoesterase [Verrucomicrobiae bacterium]|nr:metallophosphoesterase [Verrucomicrobiae bacterium]
MHTKQSVRLLAVSDLHARISLYEQLQTAVAHHCPQVVAVVGDFLSPPEFWKEGQMMEASDCARILAGLPCEELVFVRGNHENRNWLQFEKTWRESARPVHALNGEVFAYGPMRLAGFPCLMGCEDAFIGQKPVISADAKQWFPKLLAQHGASVRTLWLMHEPPTGTRISAKGSIVEGN